MMNALELLQAYLQRASSSSASDRDWLQETEKGLPSRDTVERASGQSYQGYIGEQLHPNALGIYAQPRPPPPGDEVIRQAQAYAAPFMPRVSGGPGQRWFNQQTNPSYFPGPEGSTRIASQGTVPTPQEQASMDREVAAFMDQQRRQREALSGLPEAVTNSILNQESYAEGDPVPYIYGARSLDEEARAYQSPQRDSALAAALWAKREIPTANAPRTYPEPLTSPLNQMMRRGPFALY